MEKTERIKEMRPATCRKEIKIGEEVPSEVTIRWDAGSMFLNLAGFGFERRFNEELAKIQTEKYEFSEICKNENELRAFYEAIKVCGAEHKLDVTFID